MLRSIINSAPMDSLSRRCTDDNTAFIQFTVNEGLYIDGSKPYFAVADNNPCHYGVARCNLRCQMWIDRFDIHTVICDMTTDKLHIGDLTDDRKHRSEDLVVIHSHIAVA